MRLRSRLLSITAAGGLVALALGVGPATHAFAATACDDSIGNEYKEVSIAGGPNSAIPGMPFTLAAEIGDGGTLLDPHVGVCFGTNTEAQNAAGQPEAAGGEVFIEALNPASGDGIHTGAALFWDPNSNVKANTTASTAPTYALNPGPAGTTGDTITLSIPFTVCFGACTATGTNVNPTGLLVGQLVPQVEPGLGVGYQLSTLQVWANGVLLVSAPPSTTGAYVNPFGAVAQSLNLSQGGPCIVGTCLPDGYVETTGSSIAGFQILGVPVNITVPKECAYSNPNGQCP
jgi:hypothetical protein